jgi:ubiquinone/menaquinone biosynthesis C-methylase UbiE
MSSLYPADNPLWALGAKHMEQDKSKIIIDHYNEEVEKFGLSHRSTMDDDIVRDKELEMVLQTLKYLKINNGVNKILDLGCGNGYALGFLSSALKGVSYYGLDYTPEMVELCKKRGISNCVFMQGDARKLPFEDNDLDFIYTERCLINILDAEEQLKAIDEIYRVLKPGGHYLMIECFTDGLENNNKARIECGMEELSARFHNLYFDKSTFRNHIDGKLTLLPETIKMNDGYIFYQNFLSSHYFVARVLHPLVSKGQQIKNTEFVKFFSFLEPRGNYSQIQGLLLKKE